MKPFLTVRYFLVAFIALILIALLWWYFMLQGKTESISEEDAKRGAGLSEPTFGSSLGSTYENIISTFTGPQNGTEKKNRLELVGKSPTAGAGFVMKATSTALRFVERGTGYVLEFDPARGVLKRITNTLVPRVYEAFVLAGDRIIMRSIENEQVVTVIKTLKGLASSSPATTGEVRLPENITSLAVDPSEKEVFYIVQSSEGGSGVRVTLEGMKAKQVFSSAIAGWHGEWGSEIVLQQKSSDGVASSAYAITNGALEGVVREIPGLTLLPSKDSRALLWSESNGQTLRLFARTEPKGSTIILPIRTVADKCVWSFASTTSKSRVAYCAVPQTAPGANFLDRWYRGEVHTADAWWKIDVNANSAELLYSPGDRVLDVERPIIDKSGSYVAFTNAIDKSLWLLRVSE
ncbi:hypothetical protein HY478_03980 [Candidatus Uhrbacteria bacterium]|nr:hypothetical protein [Candidatus Uhrbacteria bacterium]